MKADKILETDSGAESLGILLDGMHGPDWHPQGNGWAFSDEEYREWQDREYARMRESLEAEHEQYRASHQQLQQVRRILREFALSHHDSGHYTLSMLQGLLELAHELNPSLADELRGDDNPFV